MSDVIELISDLPEEDLAQTPSFEIFADDTIQQQLVDYLTAELDAIASDDGRSTKIERNMKIARQRQAVPPTETKDTPWENASNVEPPFALQKTNTIVTKLEGAYRDKKPIFIFEADGPYKKHAEALTKYVQKLVESPYNINLYQKLWPTFYNCVSYGTQFVKVPFQLRQMKFKRVGAEGGVEDVSKITKASPSVEPIPFEDFFTRAEWPDLQTAPWIGVRYYKHYHELKRLQQQGFYTNVDLILNETEGLDDSKEDELDHLGLATSGSTDEHNDWYAIYECNVFWDADGDGFDEDLIIHIEKSTGTILRAEYNELGTRDYVRLPYIDIPNNLYALGVGDIMVGLQDEAAALHNMRNDSMHLSMLPFVVTTPGSDFGKAINLVPGKVIRTPSPREDVVTEKFNDIGLSSITAEGLLKEYANDATGASAILSGQDAGGYNRLGAQGTQFLAGQSNSFLDAISSNIADKFGEIGMLILFQLVRNSEYIDYTGCEPADEPLLRQVFDLNVEDIPSKFKFKARVASIQDSKEVKQQMAVNLLQVYTMYGDKMTQILAQLENPQLQQAPRIMDMVSTYAVGLTKIMEKAMAGFDTDNTDDFLPYMDDLALTLRMRDEQKEMQVEQAEQGLAVGKAEEVAGNVPDDVSGVGGGYVADQAEPGNVSGPPEAIEGADTVGGGAV